MTTMRHSINAVQLTPLLALPGYVGIHRHAADGRIVVADPWQGDITCANETPS